MVPEFKLKTVREFRPETIKLIVGLGNPGARFARTYHNAGRLVVGALAGTPETKFKSSSSYLSHRDARYTFAVPRTFMNESGPAVKNALRMLRVKPRELLLIHDDADIPLGSFRLAWARGSAGHHGVESAIHAIGTKDFWRLRVGIRPPSSPAHAEGPESHTARRAKADTFVLRQMPRAAQAAIAAIAEEFGAILQTSTPIGEHKTRKNNIFSGKIIPR